MQQTRDVKEDFSSRLQDIEAKLKTIALKLEDKGVNLEEAKEETKVINQTDWLINKQLTPVKLAIHFADVEVNEWARVGMAWTEFCLQQ